MIFVAEVLAAKAVETSSSSHHVAKTPIVAEVLAAKAVETEHLVMTPNPYLCRRGISR